MKLWISVISVVASAWLVWPQWLIAAVDPAATSTHFSIDESTLGATGDLNATSTHFSQLGVDDGGSTLGDTAVGNSSSTNFQTNSGTNTSASPVLGLTVNTGTVSLGILSSTIARTATATFSVKDYTSYGYVVTIVGTPPMMGSHTMTALATDTASIATTEQFGINMVANTSPVSVGANPSQNPSASFSYGVAGDGTTGVYGTTRPYTIPNNYRYVSGETIASAPKSSGYTDYTMSFLANISTLTPGGTYSGNLSIIATGTY